MGEKNITLCLCDHLSCVWTMFSTKDSGICLMLTINEYRSQFIPLDVAIVSKKSHNSQHGYLTRFARFYSYIVLPLPQVAQTWQWNWSNSSSEFGRSDHRNKSELGLNGYHAMNQLCDVNNKVQEG